MAAETVAPRRRGRPARVTIVDGVASVRVGGIVFTFGIGKTNRLNPVGDTREQSGTENFTYAQNLIKAEL